MHSNITDKLLQRIKIIFQKDNVNKTLCLFHWRNISFELCFFFGMENGDSTVMRISSVNEGMLIVED